MLNRLIPIITIALFFSCTKDPPEAAAVILQRMETKSGAETVTTTIEYHNNKPVFMQSVGSSGGVAVNVTTRFIRNEQGIIERIIIKNPAYLTTFTADSIIYYVNHSITSGRYINMINYLYFRNGTTEYDSTFFTYDPAGMIVQATKLINTGSTGGYQEAERNEFTYTGGNLMRCRNYIFNSLFLEQTVTYDGSSNPMGFGKEWIVIGSTRNNRKFEQSSFNNPLSVSFNRNGNISTTTTTYTYHSNGYPAAKTDVLSNGSVQTSTYYY